MYWGSKIRLRGSLFLLSIALILSSGECGSNRITRRESNNSNNTIEVVTPEPQVKSKGQKLVLRTNKAAAAAGGDGFNFENVVSALISSPEAMGQLGKLKDRVMHYFEKKQDSTTEARGHGHGGYGQYGSAFGHGIGFPSLEGALLALAFLTFAVFLIDLIQQMVGRFHSGTASPLLGRRRRDLPENPVEIVRNDPYLSTLTSEVLTSIESPLYHTYSE